jgi:hypothetical protein
MNGAESGGIWNMVNYQRIRVPGAMYFFTVMLRDRRFDLLAARAHLLREVSRSVRQQRPFVIDAMVVLPDHLQHGPKDISLSLDGRGRRAQASG